MLPTERFEQLEVTRTAQLRDWLAANHARTEGVWLVTWMKAEPGKYVDRWAVLDELLCFGWIDGLRRKGEAGRTLQLITPRRQQAWAQSYKDRVARLEAEGRMAESGLAAIARAKAVGLWDATQAVDALLVPDDLQAALQAAGGAVWFEAAAPSYRRNLLRWIAAAKAPATRAARLVRVATACATGLRLPNF